MDALIAKADAIAPLQKRGKKPKSQPPKPSSSKKKPTPSTSTSSGTVTDQTLHSITPHTSLPKSLLPTEPLPPNTPQFTHIKNQKLRTHLTRHAAHASRSKALVKDAQELLVMDERGGMEVEGEMERTWRVGQDEIVKAAGAEGAQGRQEWVLDGGPYRVRYTRNGRHLAIVGSKGHVATFDWQTGTMHSELQLRETCRDITFLQDHTHYAVAQKKYVFIYDRDGIELHRLKSHIEPTRLEFLPYHWLLASVGNPGYLNYLDTTTGTLLTTLRTRLGPTQSMTQSPQTALIYLGHLNGSLTLWTPNMPTPAVRLQAHLGSVVSVGVDPSSGGGGGGEWYVATSGVDGLVKVWDCRNWKGEVRSWRGRGGGGEIAWSQRGHLAVASGSTVNIYTKPTITTSYPSSTPVPNQVPVQPPLYLTHPIPHRPLTSLRFCPFKDVLSVGHGAGVSGLLVPGSGEAAYDSGEVDPFEGVKSRREREVRGLLEKIPASMITFNPSIVGSLAPEPKLTTAVTEDTRSSIPYARLPRLERLRVSGKADGTEDVDEDMNGGEGEEGEEGAEKPVRLSKAEKEKKKMRGKNKALKRYLRKQRKNVIDPRAIAVREKLEKQREERKRDIAAAKGEGEGERKKGALDRFRKKD